MSRPNYPNCVMNVEAIRHINEVQREYDWNPKAEQLQRMNEAALQEERNLQHEQEARAEYERECQAEIEFEEAVKRGDIDLDEEDNLPF